MVVVVVTLVLLLLLTVVVVVVVVVVVTAVSVCDLLFVDACLCCAAHTIEALAQH